jgi:predicted O-methyltransferase YrrM
MYKYLNPIKYYNRAMMYYNQFLSWYLYERFYDLNQVRKVEIDKFERAGFVYDDSCKKLNLILAELGKPDFASQKGMGSVHWILFCCLNNVAAINRIFEIGTFDGETTLILSKIFPNADIVTMDLPDDDPIFATSYNRENAAYRRDFKERQQRNLSSKRIKFYQKNSFFVQEIIDQKFDLVWIDGGHLYPEVAWDICNAYHLCNPGGWIMCDDVILDRTGETTDYVGPDSREVLEYVRERTGGELTYFLKRESSEWSANPRKRKYVAVMKKSM